jgi:anti-sigma B factor antagonist
MDIRRQEFEFVNFFSRILFDDSSHICTLILSGSMDTNPILKLEEEIEKIISERKYDFIVDLTHVRYISSTGLGFLIYLLKCRKNFLFLSYPPNTILKPFKLLDLDDLFLYYHNPDELIKKETISDELVLLLKQEISLIRDIYYRKRWVKILRDYLAHKDVINEIRRMAPYIQQADHSESVTLPSEEKYACILYKFIDRAFSEIARINRREVDDITVELISKELMTNAVKHGYDNRTDGVIEANYKLYDEKVELNMIDYGKGFSTSRTTDNILPSAGLELLKKIFDEVTITEPPKKDVKGLVLGKGTMVRMTKYLGPKE